jgi:hypothetical protein
MDDLTAAVFPPQPSQRRIFVTSMGFSGAMGNVVGADNLCRSSAARGGLTGDFRAWIGNGTTSATPANSFVKSSVPYVRVDGVQIAADWADLTDGALTAPIVIDENGRDISVPQPDELGVTVVWTAVAPDGTNPPFITVISPTATCNGWNQNVSPFSGQLGDATATSAAWTNASFGNCNGFFRLYCVEQ